MTTKIITLRGYNHATKLKNALDEALASIENCSEPINPLAKTFKRQIEKGNVPAFNESDPIAHRIIKTWIDMNRKKLDIIFTEIEWFKRRK